MFIIAGLIRGDLGVEKQEKSEANQLSWIYVSAGIVRVNLT